MEELNHIQTKAATIIQRKFRKYLLDKQYQCLNNSKADKSKCTEAAGEKDKYSQELHAVRNGLESFYRKTSENSHRYQYVDDLITSINETLERLENITSLGEFNSEICRTGVSLPQNILNNANKKHEEKLECYNLQWWDKL